jgi:hypothetical protein
MDGANLGLDEIGQRRHALGRRYLRGGAWGLGLRVYLGGRG